MPTVHRRHVGVTSPHGRPLLWPVVGVIYTRAGDGMMGCSVES